MYVRHDIDGDVKTVKIENSVQTNTTSNINDLVLRKYQSYLSLTLKKIADLRKLMPYIPPIHRSFYEKIFLTKGVNGDDDAELL